MVILSEPQSTLSNENITFMNVSLKDLYLYIVGIKTGASGDTTLSASKFIIKLYGRTV